MSEDVVVPGARDVRASLDGPDTDRGCIIACPPHPQAGGTRSNPVLVTLGGVLARRNLATLRIDYGPWDEGRGEVRDAIQAVDWAVDRYPPVGVFGYSFGATIALAVGGERTVSGVVSLAPAARLPSLDTIEALEAAEGPVLLLYGERDDVVDSGPVADRARELGHEVVGLPADHHFVGQREKVAERVADFFDRHV